MVAARAGSTNMNVKGIYAVNQPVCRPSELLIAFIALGFLAVF